MSIPSLICPLPIISLHRVINILGHSTQHKETLVDGLGHSETVEPHRCNPFQLLNTSLWVMLQINVQHLFVISGNSPIAAYQHFYSSNFSLQVINILRASRAFCISPYAMYNLTEVREEVTCFLEVGGG